MTLRHKGFDAVLVVSFGGPQGMDDIRPFLANVLRGRRVSPERLEEVVHHYELFGGVSPITAITLAQAEGLAERLRRHGPSLPVYVGMRNWHPFLEDTLAQMSRDGVRRAVGFITAGHKTYSSCGQYKVNVMEARQALVAKGLADVDVRFVGDWYDREGFVMANAVRVAEAIRALPEALRGEARVVFTAHSVPVSMAQGSAYARNLHETARRVMDRLGRKDFALVYQSRSGRPQDPWLEPDVNDYLRDEAAKGLRAVVLSPIGFVCDHVEVLYDLDREAAETAQRVGITLTRAKAVNDDPRFLDMMADVVREVCARDAEGRRLPIVSAPETRPREGMAPSRGPQG